MKKGVNGDRGYTLSYVMKSRASNGTVQFSPTSVMMVNAIGCHVIVSWLAYATRFDGRPPASTASIPSSTRRPIASRVWLVALPRCGNSTTFSSAR